MFVCLCVSTADLHVVKTGRSEEHIPLDSKLVLYHDCEEGFSGYTLKPSGSGISMRSLCHMYNQPAQQYTRYTCTTR